MPIQDSVIQISSKFDNISDSIYERVNLCFFYIGHDESVLKHLTHYFNSGYKEDNLDHANNFIHQLYQRNNKLPDVVFIDVSFNEAELKRFFLKLKDNILFASLPVIYSEKQLTDKQINQLRYLQLVDDIITINSVFINYFSKVIFLKQSKLHNQIFAAENKCRPKRNYKMPVSPFIKRGIDILMSSVVIVILSPVFLLIAIAIRLESKGPVFYTSSRAGKGFKIFKFYKFRTMVLNADKEVNNLSQFNQYNTSNSGPKFFKISNDPRVTKLGKILRNTSVDELPQLLNVLKGDMSLVGNRPLPIYEAVTLTTNDFVERFSAPAGITGLWQVNKRGKADMSTEERINLDITYSRNCNVFYDLKIMAKTPVALFQKSDV